MSFRLGVDGVRLIAVDEQDKKKKVKKAKKGGDKGENTTTATPNANGGELTKRQPHVHSAPRVEEVEDE